MNITKILVDTDIGPDCDDTAAIAKVKNEPILSTFDLNNSRQSFL